jgi:hypothetical protein
VEGVGQIYLSLEEGRWQATANMVISVYSVRWRANELMMNCKGFGRR